MWRIPLLVILLTGQSWAGARAIRGGLANPYTFSIQTVTQSPRTISAGSTFTSSDPTTNFTYLNTYAGDAVVNDVAMSAVFGWAPSVPAPITWTSSNPSVASVSSSGYLTYVSSGSTTVIAAATFYSSTANLTMTPVTSATITQSFTGYIPGTLANSIDSALNPFLTGSGSESVCKFFSSTPTTGSSVPATDDSTVYYVRNSALWSASDTAIDLTGISIWNSNSTWSELGDGLDMLGGTLLTPRHVISCNHYHWNVGDVLMFVTPSGSVVHRTLTAVSQVGTTDGFIGLLNAPVPSSLHIYSVLPNNFLSYFKGHQLTQGLMGVCVAQKPPPGNTPPPQGHLKNLWAVRVYPGIEGGSPSMSGSSTYQIYNDAVSTTRASYGLYWGYAVSGDSGEPIFLVIDGELVFVGCFYGPGGSPNSCILGIHDQINALISGTGALATSGTTYTLRDHDMSQWSPQ